MAFNSVGMAMEYREIAQEWRRIRVPVVKIGGIGELSGTSNGVKTPPPPAAIYRHNSVYASAY